MKEKILIAGAGGHARSMIDSIEAAGCYSIAGFVEAQPDSRSEYRGYRVIGTDDDLPRLYREGIRTACVGVGFLGRGTVRERLYKNLREIGYRMPNIVDPTAVLASDVRLGEGCFVGKRAVLNSGCIIGDMVIINTGAVVEHDCRISDYSHVAVHAVLCGGVSVGEGCLIGAGAVVLQELRVGDHVIIGANSTVRKDMGDDVILYENDTTEIRNSVKMGGG